MKPHHATSTAAPATTLSSTPDGGSITAMAAPAAPDSEYIQAATDSLLPRILSQVNARNVLVNLVRFQERYSLATDDPGGMPGNAAHRTELQDLVDQARKALGSHPDLKQTASDLWV